MTPAILSLILQVGTAVLGLIIKDQVRRAKLLADFTEWVNQRNVAADQTVELKNNLDAQQADLDTVRKTLESADTQTAPTVPTKG